MNVFLKIEYADVMELVDVPDSKSGVGNYVPVRPRPSAFFIGIILSFNVSDLQCV